MTGGPSEPGAWAPPERCAGAPAAPTPVRAPVGVSAPMSAHRRTVNMLALAALTAALVTGASRRADAAGPLTFREYWGEPVYVTILGPALRPRLGAAWWTQGNVSDDTYLFAFGEPGNVRLVVAFSTLPRGRHEARFFVNALGRRRVRYHRRGTGVTILSEHGAPYVTLTTEAGSWTAGGIANYDLTMLVDGLSGLGPAKTNPNGHPNVRIQIRGQGGIPQGETERLLHDPHPGWGYIRFAATERMAGAPPFREVPPVMPDFPYLGIGAGKVDWFVQNYDPLYFNVDAQQLLLFPWVGFENAGNYRINSIAAPPRVDFESPFAYYNFVPRDRYAQLVIRSESFPRGDPHGPLAGSDMTRSSFRYSWAAAHPNRWSYSLQVAGRVPQPGRTAIDGVRLDAIAPAALPGWVMAQRWPEVAFVQSMGGYPGGEGIYEYTPQIPQAWPWLLGLSTAAPRYWAHPYLPAHTGTPAARNPHPGQGLAAGWRGEYSTDYFHRPLLYASPVDMLLHLLGAQGGLENLGAGWYLRTSALGGSLYQNAWFLEHGAQGPRARAWHGRTTERLLAWPPFLVEWQAGRLTVRQTVLHLSRLVVAPPQNAAGWRRFEAVTRPYWSGASPWNLAAWLGRFPGATAEMTGVAWSGFSTADGRGQIFFTLGAAATGTSDINGFSPPRRAGAYVLTVVGSRLRLTPAEPADPVIVRAAASPGHLRITVTNAGAQGARARVSARSRNGSSRYDRTVAVSIAPEGSTAIRMDLPPGLDTHWLIISLNGKTERWVRVPGRPGLDRWPVVFSLSNPLGGAGTVLALLVLGAVPWWMRRAAAPHLDGLLDRDAGES